MIQINYSFHIGERCQSSHFLSTNNLISCCNPFSGIYISFDKAIEIMNNNFKDFLNNITYFIISQKKLINIINQNKNFENIDKLIENNKFDFFHKKNYYSDADYCLSLNYTDLKNFEIDDLYYWKSYCVMPNANYNTENQIETYTRRKDRFLNILQNKNKENILLIYQNKLIKYCDVFDYINTIIIMYNLEYNLFFIIPIDTDDLNFEDKIQYHNNITFYLIKFPNLESQILNNPNDDNPLSNSEEYNKIKQKINELYDMKLHSL
jgi:hypothetical protein